MSDLMSAEWRRILSAANNQVQCENGTGHGSHTLTDASQKPPSQDTVTCVNLDAEEAGSGDG